MTAVRSTSPLTLDVVGVMILPPRFLVEPPEQYIPSTFGTITLTFKEERTKRLVSTSLQVNLAAALQHHPITEEDISRFSTNNAYIGGVICHPQAESHWDRL